MNGDEHYQYCPHCDQLRWELEKVELRASHIEESANNRIRELEMEMMEVNRMALEDMDPRQILEESQKAYGELLFKLESAEKKLILLEAMIEQLQTGQKAKMRRQAIGIVRLAAEQRDGSPVTIQSQALLEDYDKPEEGDQDDNDQEQEALPFV